MEREGKGGDIPVKLQSLATEYENLKAFKVLTKVYKRLLAPKYSPFLCQKIIITYSHLKLSEKVLKWWRFLVEKKEELREEPLEELSEALAKDHSLKASYELWDFLGSSLLKNTQFRVAKKVFVRALKMCESAEKAAQIAERFVAAGDERGSIWFYGEAFRLSLKDSSKADEYLKKIDSCRIHLDVATRG